MRYRVEINHNKPFRKVVSKRLGKEEIIETIKTAEVIFLNDDGSIKETVDYGYQSTEDILDIVDNKGQLNLNYCYISGIDFSSLAIQSLSAEDAFFDNVRFVGTKFDGSISVIGAEFHKLVSFEGATFNDTASFMGVRFHCLAYFYKSVFSEVDFCGAVFYEQATFSNVTFMKPAAFCEIIFNDTVYMDHSTFSDETLFIDTTFNSEVSLTLSNIKTKILFESVKFNSITSLKFSNCNDLELENCIIEKSCSISSVVGFNSVLIDGCKCFGIFSIPFSDNLKRAILLYRNVYIGTDIGHVYYSIYAQEFNFLKVNYYQNGEYEDEDQAYVEYRRCLRKTKKRYKQAFEWFLLDKVSCYCTKPFRVFLWAIVAIAFFAALYFIPGTVIFQTTNQPSVDITFLQQLWNRLYHSIITFFTIGYGNTTPSGWLGLFLTGLEGFVGVFLVSLFTVSFVRKVLR